MALDNVSLDIAHGEYISITGKSGSGKSTLMNQIGLIDEPSSGSIKINSEEILNYSEKSVQRLEILL